MAHSSDNSPQGLLLQSMGGKGGSYITGTGWYTGNFFRIQALEDTTLYSGTLGNIEGKADNAGAYKPARLSGALLPQGMVLFGDFTQVQISSGKAVIYNN